MSDDQRSEDQRRRYGGAAQAPKGPKPTWVDKDPFGRSSASADSEQRRAAEHVGRSTGAAAVQSPDSQTPPKPGARAERLATPASLSPEQPGGSAPPKEDSEEKVQIDPALENGALAAGEPAETRRGASDRPAGPTPPARAASPATPEGHAQRSAAETAPQGASAPSPRRITAETRHVDAGAPQGRRLWGLPLWGWPLILFVSIAVLFIVFDVRNRDRFRLNCRASQAGAEHAVHIEFQQGRRLLWPFGYETVGGAFKPLALAGDADCRRQVFNSRGEAEAAFLDFLFAEIKRGQDTPASANLTQLRAMVLQALAITREEPHRVRRREAEQALADIAYQQGRAGLSRVEQELRTALGHLQEARKRAEDRYEDLDDWIEHLENLLRTVVPSPSMHSGRLGSYAPVPAHPPSPPPATDLRPPLAPRPLASSPDAGAESSDLDARPATGGGGILM